MFVFFSAAPQSRYVYVIICVTLNCVLAHVCVYTVSLCSVLNASIVFHSLSLDYEQFPERLVKEVKSVINGEDTNSQRCSHVEYKLWS